MPMFVKNPVNKVCEKWITAMKAVVGEGNVSVEPTSTIANDKTVYARIFMIGNPTSKVDLTGDEIATTITFQCETYASGTHALSKVYALDEVSHEAMLGMGFKRTYTKQTDNADEALKRIVSRYRIQNYTGYLLGETVTE